MKRFIVVVVSIILFAAVYAQAQIVLIASLSGAQEVPAVTTGASGTAWVTLNVKDRTMNYLLTYAGLEGQYSDAHFHFGASGVSGKVAYPIDMGTPSQPSVYGTLQNLPDSVIEKFINGEIYVNIHSTAHPSGEIRGQLTMPNNPTWIAILLGASQVPPVLSGGAGTAWATFDGTTGKLHYRATVNGTADITDAHFHYGKDGANGPVVIPLTLTKGTTDGEVSVPDSTLARLVKNSIYINIHTTAEPAGEIRGQMALATTLYLTAELLGANQIPAVQTAAAGLGVAVYNQYNDTLACFYVYDVLKGDFTDAHIHYGDAGQNGKVILPLGGASSTTQRSGWADSVVAGALRGKLYLNVHSTVHQSGEIRSQLRFAPMLFVSYPGGANEVPPVVSAAGGFGYGSYYPTTRTFIYSLLAAGLADISAAHIHRGLPGVVGPVLHEMKFVNSLASGGWTVPKESFTDLIRSRTYMNVHSSQHPNGEIRGQVLFFGQQVDAPPVGIDIPRLAEKLPSAKVFVTQNPAVGSTTLQIIPQTGATGTIRIKIYNAAMNEVRRIEATLDGSAVLMLPLDVAELPSGAYFVSVGGAGWSSSASFVVKK